ncbi:terpene cyclase/mutase family protein [Streptomyces sannanensis]|uniref:Terpene cyclase/mutase family protein n=1 Tax=Streptomyces sannanensis TaxID=285536 RepID=A0ABP6S8Y0_9ACTN
MTVVRRRSAAALAAAAAVLCTAAAPAVAAPSPAPKIPAGLYGANDPTYDGVWRQSLALLAQDTVGVEPAKQAVDWLTGQQCANGGFASYRADAAKACDAKTMLDTNATAAAVQALAALGGHGNEVKKSTAWLKSVQNEDGGWSYNPGGASDANSTSVVIGALAAAGEKPGDVKSKQGKSPYDSLVSFAIPCGGKDGGAFAYQPDKSGTLYANADATAAAVLGGLGKGLVIDNPKPLADPVCENAAKPTAEQAAGNGAAYLAGALAKTGHLMSAMPGAEDQPDFGNTADAVIALGASLHGDKAADALRWLESNSAAWAKENGPAAYAQLILAANAIGFDPRSFGGANLVQQLNATGPKPAAEAAVTPSPTAAETPDKATEEKKDDNGGLGVGWIIGIGLVAGIGIGILISGRKKNQ